MKLTDCLQVLIVGRARYVKHQENRAPTLLINNPPQSLGPVLSNIRGLVNSSEKNDTEFESS